MHTLYPVKKASTLIRTQIVLSSRRGRAPYQLIVRTLQPGPMCYTSMLSQPDTMLAWNQRMREKYSGLRKLSSLGRTL